MLMAVISIWITSAVWIVPFMASPMCCMFNYTDGAYHLEGNKKMVTLVPSALTCVIMLGCYGAVYAYAYKVCVPEDMPLIRNAVPYL